MIREEAELSKRKEGDRTRRTMDKQQAREDFGRRRGGGLKGRKEEGTSVSKLGARNRNGGEADAAGVQPRQAAAISRQKDRPMVALIFMTPVPFPATCTDMGPWDRVLYSKGALANRLK